MLRKSPVLLFLGALAAALDLPAQQVPALPGATSHPAPSAALCGLVRTTFSDPAWVIATSDHILRANTCIRPADSCNSCTTCWYDRIEVQPCYSSTIVWKFATDPEVGQTYAGAAFSMASLGTGTFDGLYLRSGTVARFYQGSTTATPFGGDRNGPLYMTPEIWRSGSCATTFEPGTIFAPGGAGALSNYSVDIGRVTLRSIDMLETDNETAHNTSVYRNDFVLRRSQTFRVKLLLSREYSRTCYSIGLEATHRFTGSAVRIPVPEATSALDPLVWNYRIERIEGRDAADRTVTLEINLPPSVAVGSYQFKAKIGKRVVTTFEAEQDFAKPIVVLFNPWSNRDAVHLADAASRNEYVLAERGIIWRGSAINFSGKNWSYDQFDRNGTTLKVALHLLDGMTYADRANAGLVSRRLSAQVNSNGGGVLEGRWSGTYTGGTSPLAWSSSLPILREYDSTSAAVRYGQCWVFGGVLTSTLRVLGIPARPLTNFESAHDKNGNKIVDRFYAADGTYDRVRTRDSIWNYHVWCEAWLGAWNAVDATPQELSGGEYQLGPAPVASVRANAGGNYDVDFVYAEVNADINYHRANGSGGFVTFRTDSTTVGQNISTKAVGGTERVDITGDYKSAPMGGGPVLLPSGVRVELRVPSTANLGTVPDWRLVLTNTGAVARTVDMAMSAAAYDYRRELLGGFGSSISQTVTLAPAQEVQIPFPLRQGMLVKWLPFTRTFGLTAFVTVTGTTDIWAEECVTQIVTDNVPITLVPAGPIMAARTVNASVSLANPLTTALTNTRVTFLVGSGLQIDTSDRVTVSLGTVEAGQLIAARATVLATDAGERTLAVTIECDQFDGMEGEAAILVTPCLEFTPYGQGQNLGVLSGRGTTQIGRTATLAYGNPHSAVARAFCVLSTERANITVPGLGTILVDLTGAPAVEMTPFVSAEATLRLEIPNEIRLVGAEVHCQGIGIDLAATPALRLTNGLTLLICP